MKDRQRGSNRQQQQPKPDKYQQLLRGIAKRKRDEEAQRHCPPMRLEDFRVLVEKLPPEQARWMVERVLGIDGRQTQAASSQPAAEPPRVDARQLTEKAYQELLARKYNVALDPALPGATDDVANRSLRIAQGGERDLDPSTREALDRAAKERAEERRRKIEEGKVDLRHASPEVAERRLRELGADAVVVSGLRRHDLGEGQGSSHFDPSYGARVRAWRDAYDSARRAGRSDLDAKR